MKYCIIGCRYNGTTSLEKYLKNKGLDVIRNESIFDSPEGYDEWHFKFKNYKPIIILSEKKKHLFDFNGLLEEWQKAKPKIYYLEQLKNDPKFPKLNKGSTLKGTLRDEHRFFLEHKQIR